MAGIDKAVTVFWNQGGFYLEPEPYICHNTKRSMWRRAYHLGFTHVETRHGYYVPGSGFKVNDNISPIKQRIPKACRSGE